MADLRIQFNKASDASNRAVMADTDEASVAFAREADQLRGLVRTDIAALGPYLQRLGYSTELTLLGEFEKHLATYEKLDRSILELAVENTNLKAQRLSFGPAREAADAFRDALAAFAKSAVAPGKDRCRMDSLVAKAVVAVREIQVLQAPHIAEADDAVMANLEKDMSALQTTAKDAIDALPPLADANARAAVANAAAALGRFKDVSAQLVKLSRRNSNVRSLQLALGPKPALTAACDLSLRALQDTLAKEAFAATR